LKTTNIDCSLAIQNIIDTMLKLEEERDKVREKFDARHKIVKHWFDKHALDDKGF
jgi:hypothetical protein